MNDHESNSTRRGFIAGTGAAAALAATLGGTKPVHAEDINALMPTEAQIQGYMAIDHDGPIVMVNLLKFKPDGGAEAYAKYAAGVEPILKKLGARVTFSGRAEFCLIGNADWDAVALVEYPNKQALIQMSMSPEYQAIHHHREEGLEGQVNYAVIQNQ
jgi:uncharacterized protein (DUF1330 family)